MQSKTAESIYQADPFRLFFPLGVFYGFWAVGVWMAFALGLTTEYPGPLHTNLVLGGFEISFIVGFLMTALPRFTNTTIAKKSELALASILLLIPGALAVSGNVKLVGWASLGTLVFMLVFGIRRFRYRTVNPPDTFVFVGIALLMGIVALGFRAVDGSNGDAAGDFDRVARALLHHGFVMGLILGIGGRLLPGILGWTEIVGAQRARYEQPLPFYRVVPPLIWGMALAFLLSFPLESFDFTSGAGLRACVILVMAIQRWRLHKAPAKRTPHAWAVWLSGWCILLGAFLYALIPGMLLESEHIIFIGGYSLLTLMVASRVVLAHGKAGDLAFENKRWPYGLITLFFVVAMFTRFFATALPQSYTRHLGYAAFVWTLGAGVWGWIFVGRVFKRSTKT